MSVLVKGKTNWLNDEKSFGYIEVEGGIDLYAHQLRKKHIDMNRLEKPVPRIKYYWLGVLAV
jgi:cold shock CspA family protein